MTVDVEPPFAAEVDAGALARTARAALRAEGVAGPAALSILVTCDDTVRELNRRYRGLDEPTDVLSFGEESAEPGEDVGWVDAVDAAEPRYLGDLAIALPYTQREAAEQGQPVPELLNLLVVHGVLHLLGYDHAEPEERAAMQAREREALEDGGG
ncbi:MAG: rRNA maturation RNase YbeY [Dehalococcoidia bacterium]|nr:rRNA maturation RNase YbeY [Dehalococcoidia bacterium]